MTKDYRIWFSLFLMFFVASCADTPEQSKESLETEIVYQPAYSDQFIIKKDQENYIFCSRSEHDNSFVETPFSESEQLATLSTTHLAFLWKLDALDHLKATCYVDYIKFEEVLRAIDQGEVMDVQGGTEIDLEKLIYSGSDLFIGYPFGNMNLDPLHNAGITTLMFTEYLEEHPLGRLEWMVAMGYLVGKGKEAESAFRTIEKEYLKLESDFGSPELRPTVFTGSNTGDQWYSPSGNSFIAQFLKSSGARYCFEDSLTKGNIIMDFETMYNTLYEVDYWGGVVSMENNQEGYFTSDDRLTSVNAFKEGKLFLCNAFSDDYFGKGIVEPEIILKDLIELFHPSDPNYHPQYFKTIQIAD